MTETESMVVRVAKAIGMTIPNRSDATYVTPYTMLAARAAIEAMREPTDNMGNGLPADYRPGSHSAKQIWQAMLDKALEE